MSNPIGIAFDAYGTLLSTASISKQLATYYGQDKASAIAAQWRRYQLEYTWRLTCMNIYQDFSHVTSKALSHAVREATGQTPSTAQADSLIQSYDTLSVFPDVPAALTKLESLISAGTVDACIFSNGTRAMVQASLHRSPELAPYAWLFSDLVVIDEMATAADKERQQQQQQRCFKPARETYEHLASALGRRLKELWLVTSNPFDVCGCQAAGMSAAWVDRDGKGWLDAMGEGEEWGVPKIIAQGVDEAIEKILMEAGRSA